MTLPFDGAISAFYDDEAPDAVRDAIRDAGKRDILSDSYPYNSEIGRDDYEDEIAALQHELVRVHRFTLQQHFKMNMRRGGPARHTHFCNYLTR